MIDKTNVPPLPTVRLTLYRERILAQADRQTRRSRAKTHYPHWAVVAAASAVLAVTGSALAVSLTDFLGVQERVDRQHWTPPKLAREGGRVEVVRGEDWALMAWNGADATCVGYAAGQPSNWVRVCGRAADDTNVPAGASKYLLTYGATPNFVDGAADRRGAAFGAVDGQVAKVRLVYGSGQSELVETVRAEGLETSARFFIARPEIADWTGFPVKAISFVDRDGDMLERYVLGQR